MLISNRETKATLTRFYMTSGFLCNAILRSQGNRFATFYVAGILLLVLCRGDRKNFAQTPASVWQDLIALAVANLLLIGVTLFFLVMWRYYFPPLPVFIVGWACLVLALSTQFKTAGACK